MTTRSPLTPEEIAAVRKPYRAASLLPGRAYHDPAIQRVIANAVAWAAPGKSSGVELGIHESATGWFER